MKPVVVVHGGAGFAPEALRPEREEGCREAARAGLGALAAGGTALDAAVAAVAFLEDHPAFNAGHGAALTREGELELDASVMEGRELRAGGVTALPPFPHPIHIARAVLDDGEHVLLAAHGAARFAWAHGFQPAAPDALVTDRARARLHDALTEGTAKTWAGGTVGAVALDAAGDLAAATSTGGTVGKAAGRVGDSPIVGAGTYADNGLAACSVTGDGEAAMRQLTALRACLAATGATPQNAATETVEELRARYGGLGGLILLGPNGDVGIAKTTETMSHAIARLGDEITSAS